MRTTQPVNDNGVMKVTRRELSRFAVLAVAPAAMQLSGAQTASQPANDDLQSARELMHANSQQIVSVKLPMATEPAFHFKA